MMTTVPFNEIEISLSAAENYEDVFFLYFFQKLIASGREEEINDIFPLRKSQINSIE